jgi:hypothetical protein
MAMRHYRTRLYAVVTLALLAASTYTFAIEWVLSTSNKDGWDVRTASTHSSSAACEQARAEYEKNNPGRLAACLMSK